MKFFIKIISVLITILVLASFSEPAIINEREAYIGQNQMLSINETLKYELAIEDLSLLNNQKMGESDTYLQNSEIETVTSKPILTKRKSKTFKSGYKGSFYKPYELK